MVKRFILSAVALIGFAVVSYGANAVEVENNIENVVEIENVEAMAYCTTETYTHTKTVRGLSMYEGHYTETTITYTSGACTRCYGATFTLDCWGSRFPPVGW